MKNTRSMAHKTPSDDAILRQTPSVYIERNTCKFDLIHLCRNLIKKLNFNKFLVLLLEEGPTVL